MPGLVPPKVYYPRCVCILQALFDTQTGAPAPATFTAIPRSVTVSRNSARKADTAEVELDYRDFPLDPRLLTDVLLTVHLASLPTASTPLVPTLLNRRFVGLVDEPRTTLGSDQQTVRLTARDYTGIYLDFRWGGTPIPTPKGATLQSLVELVRAKVTPLTAPAVFTDPAAATADVSGRTGRTLFTPDQDDSAWDVLSKLCDLFGLVPVWNLDVLEVRSPTEPNVGTAVMIYGQNISKLVFYRSLKQQKNKQVKLVAWNPVTGVALEAIYPPTAQVTRLNEKGVAKPTVKQVQYNVEGPYTLATLLQLAQRVHAEISQQQLQGEIETRDLTDTTEASLLGLQNGDLLVCKLAPQEHASIAGMSPAEAVAFLSDPRKVNAMAPVVAQALVSAWTAAQNLAVRFYVSEVTHDWDRGDGYRLTIRFRDYVLGV